MYTEAAVYLVYVYYYFSINLYTQRRKLVCLYRTCYINQLEISKCLVSLVNTRNIFVKHSTSIEILLRATVRTYVRMFASNLFLHVIPASSFSLHSPFYQKAYSFSSQLAAFVCLPLNEREIAVQNKSRSIPSRPLFVWHSSFIYSSLIVQKEARQRIKQKPIPRYIVRSSRVLLS